MKRLRLKRPTKKSLNIFFKLLLGLTIFMLLFTIVYLSTGRSTHRLYEGDISLKDLYAPYDFSYRGDIDTEEIEAAQKDVLSKISPVYKLNTAIEESATKSIATLFVQIRESKKTKELIGVDKKLEKLEAISDLDLSRSSRLALIKADNTDQLKIIITNIVSDALSAGILSSSDKESLKKNGTKKIMILDLSSGQEKNQVVSAIPTVDEYRPVIEKGLSRSLARDKALRAAALEIIDIFISSNLQFSAEETEKEKAEAIDNMPKAYKEIKVKKNEILIGKGEKVTNRHLKVLMQLEKMRDLSGRPFYLVGMAILLLIFLAIIAIHLKYYESSIFRDNKNLLLLAILALFIAITSEVVVVSPLSSHLIPIAAASMLIAILLAAHSAFIFTIVMSIFVGVIAGNNFGLTIVMFTGGLAGIYAVRGVRRRSKLLLAGLIVGLVNLFTITAFNLLNNISPRLFLGEGGLGMLNGLISFLLVIGLLPVFEYLFKIPTDITLLELSDLNHPLLKEMVTKAPGTYHHSLIVGNLAEAACEAIGANNLLARVGAYYHDIGKIEKAEYFSENEGEPKNSRHENLTPSMSALVIINHVKDGVDLAHKHKLNQALIDFIIQHHGNGLIYYFFQRALEKVQDEKSISEEDFRYPGPRPQSKETAIVLLADSVEASSRTLASPTPSRVKGLVQRIVNNKFIDGQLDECNLTLKDLHKISEAFMRILNAMFHTRVEYPRTDERHRPKNGRHNHKKSDKVSGNAAAQDTKDSNDPA